MADDTKYVDLDSGSDGNPGTEGSPYKKISYAIDHHAASGAGATVTINVKGVSRNADSLVFDNTDSMHDGFNFVIQPWSGQATVVNMRPAGSGYGLAKFTGVTSGSLYLIGCDLIWGS